MATASQQSDQICQWCTQTNITMQQIQNCSIHKICNKCKINNRTCQSACPCCWYLNGTSLLSSMNVCTVCRTSIKSDGGNHFCVQQQHKRCVHCSPSDCVLCNFCQSRFLPSMNFDNPPANIQPIVLFCDAVEKKFEEIQSNNPDYNKQESADMDVDYNSISTTENLYATEKNSQTQDCRICLDDLDATSVTLPVCKHLFHKECLEKWFQSSGKQSCPSCGYLYGIMKGPQPPNGQMTIRYIQTSLPGFPPEQYGPNEGPTIEITYAIPSGTQGPQNPQPGQPYTGTTRIAYLPNNTEGKYVLSLLQKAFNDQHIFCVGKSSTTGQDNVVTWNDIHHKTQIYGGPEQFGYPDPTYLLRVRQELADKGYK